MPTLFENKLWAKIDIRGPDDCWLWTAGVSSPKRPKSCSPCISVDGRMRNATRLLWESLRGPIPEGPLVCHTCDNRRCMNPRHLWLGSNLQNVADSVAKGRHRGAAKTCKHGHALAGNNLRVSGGRRWCRACERRRSLAHYHRARKKVA